jgi:hypothetical protein
MVLCYDLLLALEKEKPLHFPNSKDINGKLSIVGELPKNGNSICETGNINAELFCGIYIFCRSLFLFYSSCIFVRKYIGSSRENDNEG